MSVMPHGVHWTAEVDAAIRLRTQDTVRLLTDADTEALGRLCASDPVAHCYVQAILDTGRLAGPLRALHRGVFLGIDDLDRPGELLSACWVGSNVVPVGSDWLAGELIGLAVRVLGRRLGSIFGPRESVMSIWSALQEGPQRARDVREHQPLMMLDTQPTGPLNPRVRPARLDEFSRVLPASVAMFTEELGYSPLDDGPVMYRSRVESLISRGHCLVDIDETPGETAGRVRFKADIGVFTRACIQLQGVWLAPWARGQGHAAAAVAATAAHALTMSPRVSLYVNDYNKPAIRTYQRVGFETVGDFATVLF